MATVNYSVPDEIKEEFNKAFARQNKSRVIARLMEQAVEERRIERDRARAIDAVLGRRASRRPASNTQIRKARAAGRP